MRTLLFLFAFFFFLVPGRALALEVTPEKRSIIYGESVEMEIKGSGQKIRLVAIPFPYKEAETVAEWQGSQKSLTVRPSRNTKYRLLRLVDDQIAEKSKPQMVWVEPEIKITAERNGPFLYSSGSLRFSDYFWRPYKNLPARQKKIYLYQTCPGSSSWSLLGSYKLRAKRFSPNIYLAWQFGVTLNCRSGGYQTLGFFFFPEMLASGDEGLGKPKIPRKEARKARQLLGQEKISSGDIERFFS